MGAIAAACTLGLLAVALPDVVAPPRALAAVAAPITAAGEPLEVPGAETVPAIPVQPGTGALVPTRPAALAVVPDGQAMHGDTPWLRVDSLREPQWPTTVQVRLYDASLGLGDTAPDSGIAWQGPVTRGWGRITRTLESGHGYAVWGLAPGDRWLPLGRFSVRGSDDPAGPTTQAGGMAVALASGELSWGWESMPLAGPVRGVSAGLQWQARQAASEGLPAGWRLMVNSGSPWATVQEYGPRPAAVAPPPRPAVQRISGARARLSFAYPATGRIQPRAWQAQQLVRGRWIALRTASPLRPGRQVVSLATGATSVRLVLSHRGRIAYSRPAAILPATAPAPVTAGPVDISSCGSAANTVGAPEAVLLRGWSGMSITFRRGDSGVYQQTFGGQAVTGHRNTLSICDTEAGRAWLFTDSSGVTTRFEGGRAVSVANQDQPVSSLTWDGERLSRLTNGVGRSISLVYSGSGDCPSAGWSRYSAPPDGMLCRIEYPGGTATDLGYVSAGLPAPQIGLVKDPGNSAVALGWDAVGRLAATRSPLVNRAAAVDGALAGVVATASYDSEGRALTLREAPGRLGADSSTQTIALPVIGEAAVKAGAPVTARVTSTAPGYSMFNEVTVEPETLEQRTSRDAAGSSTSTGGSGRTTTQTDARGLVTTSTTDARGNVVKQVGPVLDGAAGTEVTGDYDSVYDGGRDTEYEGFRAAVYPQSGFRGEVSPAFWKPVAGNGLAVQWSTASESMSAVATAVWTPSAAEDDAARPEGWKFAISAAPGVIVRLMVGDEVCAGLQCVLPLPAGPKQVTIEVQQGQRSGFVTVLAAPASAEAVSAVPAAQVRPGFGNLTKAASNDITAAQQRPDTEYAFARPETGQPTKVTFAGGLSAAMEYEQGLASSGRWGRLTRFTTPGGRTMAVTYWGTSGEIALPAVCGGTGVQSGQPATITRQDGIRVTSYYDVRGRLVASVTTGDGGATETVCTTYADDDMPVSSSVFNSSGTLIERVETVVGVDGDPLTREQTVTHGPAAPVDAGQVVRTRTSDDLRGYPVRYVDAVGTVTTTAYTAFNDPAVVTVTPPGASAPLLTFEYGYRATDRAPTSVRVNGVSAAEVSYAAGRPQVQSVSYAGGAASIALTYAPNGRPASLVSMAGTSRYTHALTFSQFGRILSARLNATEASGTTSEARAYAYDADGRLVSSLISTTIDGTGEQTRYGYAYAATQSSTCGSRAAAYPRASADALRTGGSRSGTPYVSCHDGQGRIYATTDPLLTGGGGTASIEHDALGRVTSITGVQRPLDLTWGAGSTLARVTEGGSTDEVTTTFDTYGGQVVEKQVVTPASSQTVRYGYTSPSASAPLLTLPPERAPPGGIGVNYPLPGGVRVDAAPGSVPVLTVTGLDGSALASVPVPSLSVAGVSGASVPSTGLAPRFGPYGEPLVAPRLGATGARPVYSWLAGQRQETLAGTSSITMIGARSYLPALGEFLSPDPKSESGTNLYTYTPADPINGGDPTGESNEWSWFWQIVSAVLLVAAIAIDVVTMGVATPVTTGGWAAFASWSGYMAVTVGVPMVAWWAVGKAQEASFRAQTEPSEGLDGLRTAMGYAQLIENLAFGVQMVVSLGKLAASPVKRWWRNRSIKQTFRLTEGMQAEVASALPGARRSVALPQTAPLTFGGLDGGGSQALARTTGRLSVGEHSVTGNSLRLASDRRTFVQILDWK